MTRSRGTLITFGTVLINNILLFGYIRLCHEKLRVVTISIHYQCLYDANILSNPPLLLPHTNFNPLLRRYSFDASTTDSFENIVGKGEIARNEQFLLFQQCFLLNQIIVFPFVHIFDIISLFPAELEERKFGISGKVLNELISPKSLLRNVLGYVFLHQSNGVVNKVSVKCAVLF